MQSGGSRDTPKILLGYHGTPSCNTDAIMTNGFCPRKRRSAGPYTTYFLSPHLRDGTLYDDIFELWGLPHTPHRHLELVSFLAQLEHLRGVTCWNKAGRVGLKR